MCLAVGRAAMAEAKRPGWGVPALAPGIQEAGYCNSLFASPGWEAGARPVITRRGGQRGQPASDGLLASCVHRRQDRMTRLLPGETEAASSRDSPRAAEASRVHFWARPPAP